MRIGIDDGLFINLAEKEFGLLTEYVVDIDTYQYLYLFDLFKFLTKFEIARTSEISYYCLKGMKIKHVVGYSLELLEQGIIRSIIEKLSAHLYVSPKGISTSAIPLSRNILVSLYGCYQNRNGVGNLSLALPLPIEVLGKPLILRVRSNRNLRQTCIYNSTGCTLSKRMERAHLCLCTYTHKAKAPTAVFI